MQKVINMQSQNDYPKKIITKKWLLIKNGFVKKMVIKNGFAMVIKNGFAKKRLLKSLQKMAFYIKSHCKKWLF